MPRSPEGDFPFLAEAYRRQLITLGVTQAANLLAMHGRWVRGLPTDASQLPMLGAIQVWAVSGTLQLWEQG